MKYGIDLSDDPTPNNFFYDIYSDNAGLAIKIKNKITDIKTKFQRAAIYDTYEFGKILVLNKYMYQAELGTELTEMLVHVPMNTTTDIQKVLLIGAGDGVSLSQLVKYKNLEKIDAVDIDQELTELCKDKFLVDKSIYEDPRVNWYFEDGLQYLKNTEEKYDLILAVVSEVFNEDGTPGMAYPIYTEKFYEEVKNHLTEVGIFVSDGSTVHYLSDNFNWWTFAKKMQKQFSIVKPYVFNSKRMPGGDFVLLWGSNKIDPIADYKNRNVNIKTNYYTPEIHKTSFVLPTHLTNKL